MNNNEHDNKLEQRIRFVAKRYREGSLDPDKAWQKFASEHVISRKVSFRRYWIGAAAVVLVLVGLGTWFTVERNAPDWVAITTAPGQMKDVYLPDSTLVALAGDSWIRYDAKRYDKERRAVEMNGKAFFQVTRNEARPFSVKTSQTEVTVLGTSFRRGGKGECDTYRWNVGSVFYGEQGDNGSDGRRREQVSLEDRATSFYGDTAG